MSQIDNNNTEIHNNNQTSTIEETPIKVEAGILKAMIETDWSDGGKTYDWFIGMMIGTDEYFNDSEKKLLTEQCNNVIMNFLNNLDNKRLVHMSNKARMSNPTFMQTFGKKRTFKYDDKIVKGL
jgi:hypothetical protein